MSKALQLLEEKLDGFTAKIDKEKAAIAEAEVIIKSSEDEILQREQAIESLNDEMRFLVEFYETLTEESQAQKEAAKLYVQDLSGDSLNRAETFLKAASIEIEEDAEEDEEAEPLSVGAG